MTARCVSKVVSDASVCIGIMEHDKYSKRHLVRLGHLVHWSEVNILDFPSKIRLIKMKGEKKKEGGRFRKEDAKKIVLEQTEFFEKWSE